MTQVRYIHLLVIGTVLFMGNAVGAMYENPWELDEEGQDECFSDHEQVEAPVGGIIAAKSIVVENIGVTVAPIDDYYKHYVVTVRRSDDP